MKNTLKEQIDMICQDFNFDEIHKVMTFLNWKWKFANTPSATPTLEEVKSVGAECLERAANSEEEACIVAIGPFEAEKVENTLELRFILQRVNPLGRLLNPEQINELARKS